MKNKNLLIGGGILAAIVLFVYFRNRQSANGEDIMGTKELDINSGAPSSGIPANPQNSQPTTQPTTQPTKDLPITQLTKFELEARMLRSCGVRPVNPKGARRRLYNECLERQKAILRQQGLISFNGMNENGGLRLDFGNNIVD